MEVNGAISLKKYLKNNSSDLSAFFSIAMQLAKILQELHQKNIIQRCLNPDNILIQPSTGKIRIKDCNTANNLALKNQSESLSNISLETLAYMSPEQIGRVNRIIDHRSNFYSLGIILYETLTGQLPFHAGDTMQWIHAHIAQKPICLQKTNPDIPLNITTIIMKLLAKNAGERYQNASELLTDLEACHRHWTQNGLMTSCPSGQMDKWNCILFSSENEKLATAEIQQCVSCCPHISDRSSPSDLTLCTIRKVVQVLSTETDLETLLKSFIEIAIENAGADKGYLILARGEAMIVEAANATNIYNAAQISSYPLEESQTISQAMVQNVLLSLETIVLNDVAQSDIFARDPYILQSGAKSVVCLPLLFQGTPGGVLYLENSLMTGVFTPDRLEVLKLLTIQMTYVKKLQSLLAEDTTKKKYETPLPLMEPLTERELEVLSLVSEGLSNQEIARELQLTVSTVKTHILNIYGKLRVNRRVQAVSRARELRLIKFE